MPPPVPAQPTPASATASTDQEAKLVAVDVFDTEPGTVERVLTRHGDALRSLLRDEASVDLEALLAEIRTSGGYAYVEPSRVTYYESYGRRAYLTIDIVDQRDAARRMPFLPRPTGTYPDPDGLIVTWRTYEATVFGMLKRGERLKPPDDCPVFHCFGDPRHPALRSLSAAMEADVPHHVDELAAILRDDRRDTNRAAAAYLLAYATDGRIVVADLVPALHDASGLVRNNAMRVLAEIALRRPDVDVPIAPVIEALGYPAATDRNKSAATLSRLLGRPGAAALYPRVVRDAGPILLAMLRLQQPNNHDFAYMILKTISGQTYGERDYTAWQAWLRRAATN